MPKPHHQDAEDLELLRSAAVAAGILAAGYFRRSLKSWTKENASPVSEADMAVDTYLYDMLLAARPDYGWLSEESTDDPARIDCERCFVIDPIDGTGAFLRGDASWSVSLAVVDRGRPVAGVVYAPARDELYHACLNGGAYLNQQPLSGPSGERVPPIIPGPGALFKELDKHAIDHERGPYIPSLALRLVQVAAGRTDAAVARRGAQDWDIAGAAIILSESGVALEDVCAGVPRYNKPDTRHGALAAIASDPLKPVLHEILRHIYGCPEPDAAGTEIARQQ